MKRKKYIYCILAAAGLMLTGCDKGQAYFPKNMEEVVVPVVRFDQAIQNVQESTAREDIEVLYAEYPDFMPVFVEDILGIAVEDTAYLSEALPKFLDDTVYGFRQTNQREREVFADVTDIEKLMNGAFTRIHYLWPEWEMPTVYLFISGFNASIYFADEETIAVGADMYLGSDYEYYNRVVYDYQKVTMRKECIPADVVSAYLFRNIDYTANQNRLLDNMLYRGKIMYLLSLLIPEQKPFEIMGYSEEQWKWCERNERAIWHLMMDKKDLFKTDNLVLTSYLNDGPFTAEISQDSPARLGTWVGWQIAKGYLKHHPEVSLQELMAEGDSQKILEESYYKP